MLCVSKFQERVGSLTLKKKKKPDSTDPGGWGSFQQLLSDPPGEETETPSEKNPCKVTTLVWTVPWDWLWPLYKDGQLRIIHQWELVFEVFKRIKHSIFAKGWGEVELYLLCTSFFWVVIHISYSLLIESVQSRGLLCIHGYEPLTTVNLEVLLSPKEILYAL